MGERFRHAKLLEVSENSYLITTDVRLPILGQSKDLVERTKTSISKRGYLLKQHPEYTNQAKRKEFNASAAKQQHHLIVAQDLTPPPVNADLLVGDLGQHQ